MPVPDFINDAPEIYPGEELFFTGYLELNTCRPIGMSEGSIPWTAIMEYCIVHEIEGELRDDFFHIIRDMDNEVQSYKAAKRESEKPPPGSGRRPPARRG